MIGIATTHDRVTDSTSEAQTHEIQNEMVSRLHACEQHPSRIEQRLRELDEEWDIERAIEANASTLALSGVVLAALVDRRFLLLPGVVTAFLLQHALQGWCPPVPILRGLGFRTADEINEERYALKMMRGDFERSGQPGAYPAAAPRLSAAEALAAVRR